MNCLTSFFDDDLYTYSLIGLITHRVERQTLYKLAVLYAVYKMLAVEHRQLGHGHSASRQQSITNSAAGNVTCLQFPCFDVVICGTD